MKNDMSAQNYILGLDIGTNSVGWALINLTSGEPTGLLGAGARVFEAGMEGAIESGREESRAKKRREARLRRRMLERHARRLSTLALTLQGAGFLPQGELSSEKGRLKFFADLDRSLSQGMEDPALLPYGLRARALHEPLKPYELGRALYHLAQRRGFLSSRKAPEKKDEDKGQLKKDISNLEKEIKNSGARTLGEYLSRLDPRQERIRARYTSRKMYEEEFNAIWTAQQKHHASLLNEDFKKKVHRAIFYQRPIKWDRSTIGECELEPGRKRAPWPLLPAQRFRLLQKVNDLEITDTSTGEIRKPNPEERAKLIEALETQGDLTFGKIRKLLNLKGCQFNFEQGGEERLIGNRTAGKLREIFGDRWDNFSDEEKDRIVEDMRSIQKDEVLARRGQRVWGLDEEKAEEFGSTPLEQGYCSLSRQAIKKLLPLLEKGLPYATARKELYGQAPAPQPLDELPPLPRAPIPEIRNPAVERCLTEVRKVVNSIIRKYGKPETIRIELARDLKRPRKDRQRRQKVNLANRRAREKAAEKVLAEARIANPSRADIEKWQLYEECNHQCPYTGKMISVASLFGSTPDFDVEHIIPFNRCLDNSFMNKTLCEIAENRQVKRDRTPYEAYGSNPEKWEEIVQRVKNFQGSAARVKLEIFQLKDEGLKRRLENFATRQLNDTAYASRKAVEYVGLVYGAGADGLDEKGKRRIQAGRGQITWHLRNELELNRILGGGEKTRDDHRQHAIDAVCIGLTDARTVKMLSDAASRARSERRRRFAKIPPPWPDFFDDTKKATLNLIVSHRVSRKVSGQMHDETIYSKPQIAPDGRECVHIRKQLDGKFTVKMVEKIVDAVVRERIQEHLEKNGNDPKKAFADKKDHPYLEAKDGRKIPIHTVRIREHYTTISIGKGVRERRVITGSNHHVEILETKDKRGRIKWEGEVVSTYEAMRRLKAGEPIVKRDHGKGKKFLFSLAGGEVIEIDEKDETRGLYRVRGISKMKVGGREYINLEFVSLNDARKKKEIKKTGDWKTTLLEPLRKMNCRKVLITPLGEVRRAND